MVPSPIVTKQSRMMEGEEREQIQNPENQQEMELRRNGIKINENAKTDYSKEIIEPPIDEHVFTQLDCPLHILITTYLGYLLLVLIGHVRDFLGKIFDPSSYSHLKTVNGVAPLTSDFESFYTRRLYERIKDCWNRPVVGVPGRTITLCERISTDNNKTFQLTGKRIECINMASYNYLGFAQKTGPCAEKVIKTIEKYGVGTGGAMGRSDGGTTDLHDQLEIQVANFLGKEAALVFGMGFATNSTMISAIVGKGCAIISDEFNHSSLIFGSRQSGAIIKVFRHNDMNSLESVLRETISQGIPRTHRSWKKILVIVEGLYSMEGTICPLEKLIELKKKYKFYLFIDEAHSIGALGPSGKGVCDYWGIDPKEVDILMGTFTKSFGAAGGYLAGSKELIEQFKRDGIGFVYCEPMSPAICQQVITALEIISGKDGTNDGRMRLKTIRENSLYLLKNLRRAGFICLASPGSPVIPVLIFNPAKIAAFSREALARGLATVVVGYPATEIVASRVRFCVSSAHTKSDLDATIERVKEIGDILQMRIGVNKYS